MKQKVLKYINANKVLFSKYILISLIGYSLIFIVLFILVDLLKIEERLSFLITYGLNYLLLYMVQLKYLFKAKHDKEKFFRFVLATLLFFLLANIVYNLCLKLNIHYMLASIVTITAIMPIRFLASKIFVFNYKN